MDFCQGCVSRPHRTTVSKLMLFNLFCQAKPETTVLIFATIALLISSLSNVLLVCAHFTLSSLMSGVNIFQLEL
jgi:hypothetical protein